MALQYTNIPEQSFGNGIDARSAENQIGEGFVRDLLNADVIENRVRKRAGYQSHAGEIPVRVTKLEYNAAEQLACFTLDSSVSLDTAVSLEGIRSSPIVVYGKSSNQVSGPFTTGTSVGKYYPKFTIPTRKLLTAPSGTYTIAGSEHGIGSTNFFCNIVESTSLTDKSYAEILTASLGIDTATYDVNIDYTTYQDINAIVYYKAQSPLFGSNYITTLTHTGSGSEVFSIPTATHNLANYNIIYQLYEDNGSSLDQAEEAEFLLANNGDVTVTINSSYATTFTLILATSPTTNSTSGIVNANATGTVILTGLTKPWLFYNIYLEQTPGGTKERVQAESIEYDDVNKTATITFDNQANVARNFIVYYDYGDTRSNVLCVEDAQIVADGTDNRPQLTIWGLSHKEIYATKVDREGWTNHIDTYRRSGNNRVIAGLGGNLFSAQTYSEASTEYLLPLLYPSLQSRTSTALRIGPLFYDTGDTPQRSRGYVTGDTGGTNWATVTAVEYDTGNSLTKFTLSVPNMQILDSTGTPTTIGSVVDTGSPLGDYVTVSNMSYSRHEGTFRIEQISSATDTIYMWVDIPTNSSDYNDANVGGQAAVLTDQITWLADAYYIPNDTLLIAGQTLAPVVSSDGATTVVGDLSGLVQIPAGVVVTATRQSDVIPLRTSLPAATDSVTNLVRNDVLTFTGIARNLVIKHINADSDRNVSVYGDGETLTVTLLSGDTSYLSVGQKILLTSGGDFTGTHEITAVTSSTEFECASEISGTGTANLSGKTIQIDESLQWADTQGDTAYFYVNRRWIPIEAPTDNFTLTPDTYVRYFNEDAYTSQSFIRSTMVSDNLYLTNGRDEIMKMDGTNLYRAGLPAWQAGLFTTIDTAASARIVTGLRSITTPGGATVVAGEGRIEISAGQVNAIPVGNTVKVDNLAGTYTVRSYETDGTKSYILVDRALTSAPSAPFTISEIGAYRYYIRLNAIDANNNIITSAMTSSEDMTVQLTGDAAINLKLVGLPAFDNYDYDRIEVQIYRTKLLTGTTVPTFYLITTLPLSFDNTLGYVNFTDSFSDVDLIALDQLSGIAGAELGIGWSEPLRAKYITTADNRLVLANVRDYQELDVQIVAPASLSNTQIAGDTFLLRRDSTDTGTTTNMVDRAVYQFRLAASAANATAYSGVAGTSFTVNCTNTAAAGDWVYLYYSTVAATGRSLKYAGWWQIASATGTDITINYDEADSTITVAPDKALFAADPNNIPVLLGTDGNLGQLNGDTFDTFDATRKLALAINSTMRQVDISIAGMEEFRPWLQARSGNDVSAAGKIIIRGTETSHTFISLTPTFTNYSLFVNGTKVTTGVDVSSAEKLFPSRLLVSYANYPELYDSPTAALDLDSLSAIDVNPADGQEITGVIPFFGEAAFTAAQQAGILVVFKSNSIYLVDINQKVSGGSLVVQRLETQGLGCTFPYSIASTKNGIIFANNSGIYCLRKDQSIQYIGKYMERNWVDKVDQNLVEMAHGHHYGVGRMYKLSVGLSTTEDETTGYNEPSEVYVYNHTQEEEGRLGAWGRYDNHTAIGWANLNSNAFWASTNGQVYQIRNTGLVSDYRDSDKPVIFSLETRPNSYGNSGIRKVLDKITVNYRASDSNTENSLLYSVDLDREYSVTTPYTIAGYSTDPNGMGDVVGKDIIQLRHSVRSRRGVYFSIKIVNEKLDQNVEIAGIDYRVGGLDNKGITSAGQTQK